MERPTTVIEVGLAYGSSAFAIAKALVGSGVDSPHHLIIDAYHGRGVTPMTPGRQSHRR